MQWVAEYGMFLAEVVTIVIAVAFLIGLVVRAVAQGRRDPGEEGDLVVKRLDDHFDRLRDGVRRVTVSPQRVKAERQERAKARKARHKKLAKGSEAAGGARRPVVYVLDFDGDLRASQVGGLREEITAVIGAAAEGDEVVVRLRSPGGLVHAYGLAASQLDRLRSAGVRLTAAVDQVAASGGYMMACVADQVLAAPFAIVGSIGVVAGIPNFRRLLHKHDVDYEQLTAGQWKRTLSILGENTEEGRAKFQEEIEATHGLFKDFVKRHRPGVDLERIATGEHWYGSQAVDLGLVDALQTSDDYLVGRSEDADIVQVSYRRRKSLSDRLGVAAEGAATRALEGVARGELERRLL